jgi:hypothetical protein
MDSIGTNNELQLGIGGQHRGYGLVVCEKKGSREVVFLLSHDQGMLGLCRFAGTDECAHDLSVSSVLCFLPCG